MTQDLRPETLTDAFQRAADVTDRGYVVLRPKGRESFCSYAEVIERSQLRAGALLNLGLAPGDRVGLMLVEVMDFITTFFGAVMAGIQPVPMFPPLSLSRLQLHLDRSARILQDARCRALVTDGRLALLVSSLVDRADSLKRVLTVKSIRASERGARPPSAGPASPSDAAYLQFTSGTTAFPKCVQVTHGMIVENVLASAGEVVGTQIGRDVGVSWLPLFHDMGMSFATVGLITTAKVVFIPTLSFVRRPNLWLDTIHRHRGTVTYAPNFAFGLAARTARREHLNRWDLSCLRVLGCGAEPIRAETLRQFQQQFGPACNLPPQAFQPCYGLAEATLAVTMVPVEEVFQVDRVEADSFQREGIAQPAGPSSPGLEFVSCGRPLRGHEIVIGRPGGLPASDRQEGSILLRGPCVTPGYFENPAATTQNLEDGWLRTDDLGYMADGNLFVTGRRSDVITLAGRRHHPHFIEWSAGDVKGIRKGSVIAFSASGERLIVAAETREKNSEKLAELRRSVAAAVARDQVVPTPDVLLAPPGALPKSTSGKVQRRRARELHTAGRLGSSAGSRTTGWFQVITLILRSLWAKLRGKW